MLLLAVGLVAVVVSVAMIAVGLAAVVPVALLLSCFYYDCKAAATTAATKR